MNSIAKLSTRIARKRRQQKRKDLRLLRWRRWVEATFFDGDKQGVNDDRLMARVSELVSRERL